jgi:prepilin-type N-terminal cleavage/methylation domain-containing protein
MRRQRQKHRGGFTLLELILALTIGLVVLTTATAVAASTWQSVRGVGIRDNVTRNSRYIGVTLQRDIQETGVDLASSVDFGSLAVWNDTVAILRVAYEPTPPGEYPLSAVNFPTGVCGATCVDIETGGPAPQLGVGDLARIQVSNVRRLIYVTAVSQVNGVYRIQFADTPTLLSHAGGIGGLAITTPASVLVQRLGMVVYWRANGQLFRATRFNPDLTLRGEALATGVQALTARLVFTDGTEAPQADNGSDGNANNDYDDIAGLRVRATLQGDRIDPKVNGGQPVRRDLQWWYAPRNLVYERNRI